MAETGDILERSLDSLGATGTPPPPPAAYLRAVGHRRTQRRLRHASMAAAVLLVAGAGVFFASRAGAPPGLDHRILADTRPVTTGSYHYYSNGSVNAPSSAGPAASPDATYAADWRNEEKLARLVGNT